MFETEEHGWRGKERRGEERRIKKKVAKIYTKANT